MTQEEKDLLLKDLCARLPYGLWIDDGYALAIHIDYSDVHFENYFNGILNGDVKPYLRPLSTMTEDEMKTFPYPYYFDWIDTDKKTMCSNDECSPCLDFDEISDVTDYLNVHHFDYRGLIVKGLALEAPEDMYNTDAN